MLMRGNEAVWIFLSRKSAAFIQDRRFSTKGSCSGLCFPALAPEEMPTQRVPRRVTSICEDSGVWRENGTVAETSPYVQSD
jgi:hypothetical protein